MQWVLKLFIQSTLFLSVFYYSIMKQIADIDKHYSIKSVNNYMQRFFTFIPSFWWNDIYSNVYHSERVDFDKRLWGSGWGCFEYSSSKLSFDTVGCCRRKIILKDSFFSMVRKHQSNAIKVLNIMSREKICNRKFGSFCS
jgi:hypothetical protein